MIALAVAARFETDERERLYPALVARGKITELGAVDDTQCWHVIARAFETGTPLEQLIRENRGPGIGCYDLRSALDRAIKSRQAAWTLFPDDAALAERRDAVIAIDALLRPRIEFWCDLNDTLRQRAIDAQAATAKAA